LIENSSVNGDLVTAARFTVAPAVSIVQFFSSSCKSPLQ